MKADRTIVVLDDETVNEIAAGEIIERPASVVKELVENAIDAGASGITVEIQGVPGEFIRVSDDGSGMSRHDAKLAFLRHATSKIRTACDLKAVLSMGFRGEALPSIAAVSRMELVTRRAEDEIGTRVTYEGGVLLREQDASSPVGCQVTCRDLFFNTPARRKFQRSPSTELRHIHDVFSRLALARPEVRMRLLCAGKEAILAQGDGDRRMAIASVYGSDLAKALLPIAAGTQCTRIVGFISAPDTTRPRRDAQCVFVNGRPVVVPPLMKAVENAYGRRLPTGRHPAVFLWVSADPDSIDVNVHPTKREVRFSSDHDVFRLAAQAVSSALRTVGAAPDLGHAFGHDSLAVREARFGYRSVPSGEAYEPLPGISRHVAADEWAGLTADICHLPETMRPNDLVSRGGRFVPLGVFQDTYVLAADGCDLVVIDQHAAHERVIYEAILKGISDGAHVEVQTLFPEVLEVAPGVAASLPGRISDLAKVGIMIEEFGPSSFLLRGVPAALSALRKPDIPFAILRALEALADEPGQDIQDDEAWQGKVAAELACRAAVKAGDPLGPSELEKLLVDLARTSDAYSCPHGRPTLLRISLAELERIFRRT